MRFASLVLIATVCAGCASSRWQVIPADQGPILLDQTTGKTWWRVYYQRPGEETTTPYWKEMQRGEATTRPTGGA
jgi:hypothetical protein